jgi:hypothetical protein
MFFPAFWAGNRILTYAKTYVVLTVNLKLCTALTGPHKLHEKLFLWLGHSSYSFHLPA